MALKLQRCLQWGLIGGVVLLPLVLLSDTRLLTDIATWRTPALDIAMQGITRLGLGGVDIALFVLILIGGWWSGSQPTRLVGLYGAIAVSGAGGLDQVLKHLLCRARPGAPTAGAFFAKFPCIPTGYFYASFPSGHATTAFAAATFLSLWKPRWAPVAFCVAGLVGVSRVYLGSHFPSDVLAGAILGSAVSLLAWQMVAGRMDLAGAGTGSILLAEEHQNCSRR